MSLASRSLLRPLASGPGVTIVSDLGLGILILSRIIRRDSSLLDLRIVPIRVGSGFSVGMIILGHEVELAFVGTG